MTEEARLEELWRGDFGNAYTSRNLRVGSERADFWSGLLDRTGAGRVLEVGSNVGANLDHILNHPGVELAVGVDINPVALADLHSRLPSAGTVQVGARALPFKDGVFDLTFTMALLIHQPDSTLRRSMEEVVRTSGRWVMSAEYESEEVVEVEYRGQSGAMFKRDYRRLYESWFPELRRVDGGDFDEAANLSGITWHLFERTSDV